MDFCPRLNFSLTVFVLSLYLVEEALCPESEGSCSSDDGTSCKETGSLGQLSSSHVSGLNGTFILGKQPQRQTSDADDYSSAVYISVKTTVSYHESRLAVLLLTWLQTVRPEQVMALSSQQPAVSFDVNTPVCPGSPKVWFVQVVSFTTLDVKEFYAVLINTWLCPGVWSALCHNDWYEHCSM